MSGALLTGIRSVVSSASEGSEVTVVVESVVESAVVGASDPSVDVVPALIGWIVLGEEIAKNEAGGGVENWNLGNSWRAGEKVVLSTSGEESKMEIKFSPIIKL